MTVRKTIAIGLSGLGPRGCMFVTYMAAYLGFHRKVRTLPRFNVHITAFDICDKDAICCGNAFQKDCDAAANTPLTVADLKPFDHLDTALEGFLDLRAGAAKHCDIEQYKSLAKARNPLAYTMFQQATLSDGTIDWSRVLLMRGEWGRIQSLQFRMVLKFIEEKLPQLRISINPRHEVVGTDFGDPRKPILRVRKVGCDNVKSSSFDQVVFTSGTTSTIPVGKEVAPRTYSGTPSYQNLRDFLYDRRILVRATPSLQPDHHQDLIFRRGARIAIAGFSLSAYDFIQLIFPFLVCAAPSVDLTNGYNINDDTIKNHQGLVTFISRTPRTHAPKHNDDMNWQGNLSVLSSEEMHALLLQKNYNWFDGVDRLLTANVAHCVKKLPDQINSEGTSSDRMRFYYEQNLAYLAGESEERKRGTEVGLIMAGDSALVFGAGFEKNPQDAEDLLALKAPFTRAGRFRWPLFRSATVEMSDPSIASNEQAVRFINGWEAKEFSSIGSPLPIQHLVAVLFTRGIATHATGDFEDIRLSETGHQVHLGRRTFDALIAPRSITANADKVLHSHTSIETLAPGQPMYGKGRHLIALNGSPIHAFDFGLGGQGVRVGNSKAGIYWNDTHSHDSAAQSMQSFALQTIIQCAALAHGFPPIETVQDLFKQVLPSRKTFDNETVQFAPVWEEVQQKINYLESITESAGSNGELFRLYFSSINDSQQREKFLRTSLRALPRDCAAKQKHIPPFSPVTRDEFERRFIDYTVDQLEGILDAYLAKFVR